MFAAGRGAEQLARHERVRWNVALGRGSAGSAAEGGGLGVHLGERVSERSERALWKTRAMKCAKKWLQTTASTTKLTHPIRLARLVR